MKRLLALLIAAIMLLAIMPTALADDEPVTLTLFYESTRPINEYTELTHQYIKDNLGIDINLIQGGDNWKQQLSLYITSGDIPDLMAFMDQPTFQGYAADGAFYDITDRVRNYDNIMNYLDSVVGYTADDMLARTTLDGRIYGIPGVTIARSYYSENIRTDWLEKLGLEIPKTLDEFTEVMRAFTKNDPDGNGVDDTYGFSGAQQYNSLTPFFGAFGARPDQAFFLGEDDKITVARARKIQRFLSQSFFVAEQFTGQPGQYVPLKETIRGFKEILEGKHDDLPEGAFYMVGTIDDAIAKAKSMEVE